MSIQSGRDGTTEVTYIAGLLRGFVVLRLVVRQNAGEFFGVHLLQILQFLKLVRQ